MKNVLVITGIALLSFGHAQGCEDGFRRFAHALLVSGPVCIPESPERIAALDRFSFETLLALGVEPVAASAFARSLGRDLPYLEPRVAAVRDLGQPPSVEGLLEAQPDLILSTTGYGEVAQLAEVAPTVQLEFGSSAQWQEVARAFGAAAGLESETARLFRGYQARLAALRESVGDPGEVEVSVVRVAPDYLSLYSQDRSSFLGVILEDAGFAVPQAQAEAFARLPEFDGTITLEQLPLVNADALFIWSFATDDAGAADAQTALGRLRENPLWRTLPVIQADEAHVVGGYWIGSSFHAAHAVIDDLLSYVADVDPAVAAPNPLRPEVGQR